MATLVVVDRRVSDVQTLVADLPLGTEVLLLESDADGVGQIADYLAARTGIDALHVLSHGDSGLLQLGASILSADNLADHADTWSRIGQALNAEADILLYGCNLAAGEAGQQFVDRLATLTGADLAASTDPTGAGGDWVLEAATGAIEAAIVLSSDARAAYAGTLDWVIGTDGNDSLVGTPGNDLLSGLAGNDTLNGGAGDDMLAGGPGNDAYVVDTTTDILWEEAGWGTDTVLSSVTFSLVDTDGDGDYGGNTENLTLTGTANINATGNGSKNRLIGNSGNNLLNGGAGNDTLEGGGGTDSLSGGADSDTYVIDSATDVLTELAGQGTDTVQSSVTYSLVDTDGTGPNDGSIENLTLTGTANINGTGNTLSNVLVGNTGHNQLQGGAANDSLAGSNGNDTLDGGTGSDTLAGNWGNDKYVVDSATDVLRELAGEGTDTVQSSVGYSLADTDGDGKDGGNIENLTLVGTASINGTGNDTANQITGNSGNNILDGGAGNDTLEGGAGADVLAGGLNDDTYLIDSTNDRLIEGIGQGSDTVLSSVTYSLLDTDGAGGNGGNIENLILIGTGNVDGTGNDGNNRIVGNDGNNILDGGSGLDTLEGGAGNDSYVVDSTTDVLTELAGQGTDTVQSSVSYGLVDTDGTGANGGNIENLTLTGMVNIDGTGNDVNNRIIGNSGNNQLQGAAGDDTLDAGAGNDTLDGGAGSDRLGGDDGSDSLQGGDGRDTLDGGAGADALAGGSGDDAFVVDDLGDQVTEGVGEGADRVQSSIDYILPESLEDLVLTGAATVGTGNALPNLLTGNAGDNQLLGVEGNDTLNGAAGHDTLDGGTGADSLDGGPGDDTYVVDDPGDRVSEGGDAGIDRVWSGVDFTLSEHVEALTLTGPTAREHLGGTGNALANELTGNAGNNELAGAEGDDTLDGDAGNDVLDGALGADALVGGAGRDTLDGGTGADSLAGGSGNDTYVVDEAGDQVTEDADSGIDHVQSGVDFTLPEHVEHLVLAGTALVGSGNALANAFTGNAADNAFRGGAGDDTVVGGGGADSALFGGGSAGYRFGVDANRQLTVTDTDAGNGDEGTDTLLDVERAQFAEGTVSWQLLGESRVNSHTASAQWQPAVAGLVDGGYWVGWASFEQEGSGLGYGIYGQQYGGDSAAAGGEAHVNTTAAGKQEAVAVTGLADGGYLAAWSGNGVGDEVGVFVRRYGANGEAVADTEVRVNTTTANLQQAPAAAALGGGYVVAWSGNGVGDTAGIYAQRFGADDGRLGGQNTPINTTVAGVQEDPGVAVLADGRYLVAWSGNGVGDSSGVFLQRFDAAGVRVGGETAVNTTVAGDQTGVAVAALADGGYLAVWSGNGVGDDVGVFARRYGANGVAVGTETRVNGTTAGSQTSAAVAALADGGYVVAWSGSGDGDGAGIFARRYGANGTPVGGETRLNTTTADLQQFPAVAALADGGYLVSWASQGQDGDNWGVYAQRFYANGATVALTGDGNANLLAWSSPSPVVLAGGVGDDTLDGGEADDRLDGGVGADRLLGRLGDDAYGVDDPGDRVVEAIDAGRDRVTSGIDYTLPANVEMLVLTGAGDLAGTGNALANTLTGNGGANRLTGWGANDTLAGGAGDDHLEGGSGNDLLDGGAGTDTLVGGTGNDTYVVDDALDVVTEMADGGTDLVKSSVTWSLGVAGREELENLTLTGTATINGTGNAKANQLAGNGAPNRLSGLGGDDSLAGGSGSDTLVGGGGNDTLASGAGEDAFVFDRALNTAGNVDTVKDFSVVSDTLWLDNDVFTAFIAENVALAASAFHSGPGVTNAHDGDDRILYDTATGTLYYDADGDAATAAPVTFAVLGTTTHPALTHEDFFVTA